MRIKIPLEEHFFIKDPIAKVVRKARAHTYDSEPFVGQIKELLKQRRQSYREAALATGLDHQCFRRILAGQQPSLINCILLANYFGVNPNEFLRLAGWPTIKVFDKFFQNVVGLEPQTRRFMVSESG